MIDIGIIGAGPAGLTAAIYAKRAGRSVQVFEAGRYGGQIVNASEIENYPGISRISGFQFAEILYEQAKSFGVEITSMEVTEISPQENSTLSVKGEKGEYEAKAVILAGGVKKRLLNIPGEKELTGAGVSYCAVCDGMFFRGKKAAVVGGGNAALEDTVYLSELCESVVLIHRRNEFRGEQHLLDKLKKKENVSFLTNAKVTALTGDKKLENISVEFNDDREGQTVSVSGLFIAVGSEPSNQAFANLADLDEQGFILAGENTETRTRGVFAAGDTRTKKLRQLTTAVSDGAAAASAASEYIRGI